MALAAATVAAGRTPIPRLIAGRETLETGDHPPADPQIVDGLRSMMRLVVTDSTAKDINGLGEVYGKTGETEFEGGSHAWFTGYRGDLAFAALIVGGEFDAGSPDGADHVRGLPRFPGLKFAAQQLPRLGRRRRR